MGTVRRKNQVNALVKIMVDFSVSTIAYFFIGYGIAYGIHFMHGADVLSAKNGYELVKFFFLLTFAAAIPAIISGGIAERSKFNPQLAATFALVGFVYPFFEGIAWNHHYGIQDWLKATFGYEFHDFAGSVVVHAMGGWIALVAVVLLGARYGRYGKDGRLHIQHKIAQQQQHITALSRELQAFNPKAVLNRGYAIVQKEAHVIKDSQSLTIGDRVNITLATGSVDCNVTCTLPSSQ